jgi:hypothetical protein
MLLFPSGLPSRIFCGTLLLSILRTWPSHSILDSISVTMSGLLYRLSGSLLDLIRHVPFIHTGPYSIRKIFLSQDMRFAVDLSESYITTDGQLTSLSWNKAPIWGLRPDLYYCQTVAGLLMWGRSLWREDGSVCYNCCWRSPAQTFSDPSPVGLATIFYCLRFFLFVASYDSQGYGGGIGPRLHAGVDLSVSDFCTWWLYWKNSNIQISVTVLIVYIRYYGG